MNKRDVFIKAEAESRDTIDVKRVYVVMCGGNFADAVMLSQIIYWNLPDKAGKTKLRVQKDGEFWLAKTNKDWYDEIAMTEQVAGRARRRLAKLGFIESRVYRFDGLATSHIRIKWDAFIAAHNAATEELYRTDDPIVSKSDNRSYQKATSESSNLIRPLTESTTETITETTCSAASGNSQFKYPDEWGTLELSDSWKKQYKKGYIQEKLDYVASKHAITAPWEYVKAALEGNWGTNKGNGQIKSEAELIDKFRDMSLC